jgi:hypothetical protein
MSIIAHPGRQVDRKGSSIVPRFCLGISGLSVVIYKSLCRCAPLCPNHEPRLAGDPGES